MKIPTLHRPLMWHLLIAGFSVLTALGSVLVDREPDKKAPPAALEHPAAGDVIRGRKLFAQSCAHCHGGDGRGSGEDGDGPDLHDLAIGNARIAAVIRTGIPDEMPSFAKKHQSPDIADLTAYLRTLR